MQAGCPRILVIDDEQGSRSRIAHAIHSEGWSFYFAETVEEATAAVRDLDPDVIVLEPRAEDGRAAGLLTGLRRGEWIPVTIMTADPKIDAEWGLEHGASGVFRKPEGVEALVSRIAELLDRKRTDRPA